MSLLDPITSEGASLHLRDALRAQCMPMHMKLENVVEAGGFFADLTGYRRWLGTMREVHQEFTQAYDRGAQALGMTPVSAPLLRALDKDLSAPRNPLPLQEMTTAEAIGVAYVFEGSAMGGKLLLRRIADMAQAPTSYLNDLVATSRTRWPACKDALQNHNTDREAIIIGAQQMFEHLQQVFLSKRAHHA